MKRLSLIALLGLAAMASHAQFPVSDPHCAYCDVNLRTASAHKSNCPYYSKPSNEEPSSSSSSASSSSSTSNSKGPSPITPFDNGRCPECGRLCKPTSYIDSNNIHSGCRLGEAIKEYYHYMHIWSKAKKSKASDEAWSKMQDAKAKIRIVAEEALRRGSPSTHLRDYTPMQGNKPTPPKAERKIQSTPAIAEPKFESVKVMTARSQGEPSEYYDVTQRDERGILRHGLIRGTVVSEGNLTIPCVCDRIELIDGIGSTNRGVMAKITVNGVIGVMNADSGEPIIQPAFSYLNTYYTLKGGMYFIVGDSNHLGAYHVDDEVVEVVPVTDGYTLDKVKSLIAEQEKK